MAQVQVIVSVCFPDQNSWDRTLEVSKQDMYVRDHQIWLKFEGHQYVAAHFEDNYYDFRRMAEEDEVHPDHQMTEDRTEEKESVRDDVSDTDDDKMNVEPRELSPTEPGRMEERGFMTWASPGIVVGEN